MYPFIQELTRKIKSMKHLCLFTNISTFIYKLPLNNKKSLPSYRAIKFLIKNRKNIFRLDNRKTFK